jgi:hypothetical protein
MQVMTAALIQWVTRTVRAGAAGCALGLKERIPESSTQHFFPLYGTYFHSLELYATGTLIMQAMNPDGASPTLA